MGHLKKYFLHYIILIFAAGLSGTFIYILNAAPSQPGKFLANSASQDLLPFNDMRKSQVIEVLETEETQNERYSGITQKIKAEFLEGLEKGGQILAVYDDTFTNTNQRLSIGDKIVVAKIQNDEETSYVVIDKYRLDAIWWGVAIFLLLVIIFAGIKGITSLLGLVLSLAILLLFIAPSLLEGKNPLLVSGTGAGLIAITSILLAHGYSKRTMLAVVSTLLTLSLTILLAVVFSKFALLFGRGTEEAFYLQAGFLGGLNLQGLLLGGIIIGTLGVLDDVTTTQTAAVHEISKADPNLNFSTLYKKGLSVGKEHIASLINTLVMAYAGASLPLFLLFTTNNNQPLWVLLNSEFLAEEIVRTLVGSASLILAVPISTFFAAKFFASCQDKPTNTNARQAV